MTDIREPFALHEEEKTLGVQMSWLDEMYLRDRAFSVRGEVAAEH